MSKYIMEKRVKYFNHEHVLAQLKIENFFKSDYQINEIAKYTGWSYDQVRERKIQWVVENNKQNKKKQLK